MRSSEPGERRLCSRRVKMRAVLRKVRSGESPREGNAVTAMMGGIFETRLLWSPGTKINSRGHFDVIAESVNHGTGSTSSK